MYGENNITVLSLVSYRSRTWYFTVRTVQRLSVNRVLRVVIGHDRELGTDV